MRSRLFAVALVVVFTLAAASCGGDSEEEPAASRDATATTDAPASSGGPSSNSGCGVTLADVQAALPANTPVQQNRTPDAERCNFTWQQGGNWGIDAAYKRGGRQQIEASPQAPAGPDRLRSGATYESIAGLGDKAWASGDGRQVGVVALKGDDVVAVGITFDGTAAAGARTASGLNADWLAICKNLAAKALR